MKTLSLLFAMSLCACGGPKEAADPHTLVDEDTPTGAEAGKGSGIARSEVVRVVDGGLGVLLARAELNPVLRERAFVGFEIVKFDSSADLARVGMRPGDVLVSVGGKPIRTPEEAQVAFDALKTAPAVVLEVERAGIRRRVTTPIGP